MGEEGCGAVCQVREVEGGVSVARARTVCVGACLGEDASAAEGGEAIGRRALRGRASSRRRP
jgi:hypothetical protein